MNAGSSVNSRFIYTPQLIRLPLVAKHFKNRQISMIGATCPQSPSMMILGIQWPHDPRIRIGLWKGLINGVLLTTYIWDDPPKWPYDVRTDVVLTTCEHRLWDVSVALWELFKHPGSFEQDKKEHPSQDSWWRCLKYVWSPGFWEDLDKTFWYLLDSASEYPNLVRCHISAKLPALELVGSVWKHTLL